MNQQQKHIAMAMAKFLEKNDWNVFEKNLFIGCKKCGKLTQAPHAIYCKHCGEKFPTKMQKENCDRALQELYSAFDVGLKVQAKPLKKNPSKKR